MAIQTATSGNLENISNIVLAKCRYTAESAAPCKNLIEHFSLGSGQKQLTIPKSGSISFDNLTDGIDIVDSKDLAISTTDLTTGEVGGKFIITDKLARQFNEDVFSMMGRLAGDAQARKVDMDIIALFAALNTGTTLGVSGNPFGLTQVFGVAAHAQANLYPAPVYIVEHPIPLMQLQKSGAAVGATYFAGLITENEELLRRFFSININGINMFWDANIVVDASSDAVGAIFSKNAMAYIESKDWGVERERDASLRAWEVVYVADYGVFEIDDSYGAPLTYAAAALATTT